MSIFNLAPAKLMQMLGIDPEHIQQQVAGFQAGMTATIQHFDGRLSIILANQEKIEALLSDLVAEHISRTPAPRSPQDAISPSSEDYNNDRH